MSEGLITQFGKWLDQKFETCATEKEVEQLKAIVHLNEHTLKTSYAQCIETINDLKTRMEKIELYSGMTRKVDPTKPPIAKSAFSM